MGARGPKAKPTAMKRAAGNPGMRALNEKEPKPTGNAEPPKFLDRVARAEWRRVAPELERMGILTAVDQSEFAAYCQSWSEYLRSVKELNEKHAADLLSWPASASGKHPLYGIVADAAKRFRQFAGDFGLNPSARSGIVCGVSRGDIKKFAESKPDLKVAK